MLVPNVYNVPGRFFLKCRTHFSSLLRIYPKYFTVQDLCCEADTAGIFFSSKDLNFEPKDCNIFYIHSFIYLYLFTMYINTVSFNTKNSYRYFSCIFSYYASVGIQNVCPSDVAYPTKLEIHGTQCYIVKPEQQCISYAKCSEKQ